jgi:hypothetical protein
MGTACGALSWACVVDYASSFANAFTGSNARTKPISFTSSEPNTHTFAKSNANTARIRVDYCHHRHISGGLSRIEEEYALSSIKCFFH